LDRKEQIGAFIMAGGESSRMGRPKALLPLNGAALILHMARTIECISRAPVVIGPPAIYEPVGLRAIGDEFPGAGPLGGIATALGAAENPWNFIVACDLPYLTNAWLEYIAGRALASPADAVIPMSPRGAEPLCAMYHRRCDGPIRDALAAGTRKITDALGGVRVESITPSEWKAFDSEGYLFKNMNSPADYAEAQARLEQRGQERE
jgi:molybdopterin-guanine dinucleotide biosynthesis protein A